MDINYFSKINLQRCEEGFKHKLESWSEAEWTNAIAGEIGELLIVCNTVKKLIRFRDNVQGNFKPNEDLLTLKIKAAEELADIIIYADLTLARLGFNSNDVIKQVFNFKSKQINSTIMLAE